LDAENNTIYYDVSYLHPENRLWCCSAIHHEIFHAIDFANDVRNVDDDRWSSLNPPDFKYGKAGVSAQAKPETTLMTETYPGFFNHYSTTGVAEDKAEVFANLMVESAAVENRIKKDAVLQAKVEHMRKLIANLCPEMKETFWARAKQLDRSVLG